MLRRFIFMDQQPSLVASRLLKMKRNFIWCVTPRGDWLLAGGWVLLLPCVRFSREDETRPEGRPPGWGPRKNDAFHTGPSRQGGRAPLEGPPGSGVTGMVSTKPAACSSAGHMTHPRTMGRGNRDPLGYETLWGRGEAPQRERK